MSLERRPEDVDELLLELGPLPEDDVLPVGLALLLNELEPLLDESVPEDGVLREGLALLLDGPEPLPDESVPEDPPLESEPLAM